MDEQIAECYKLIVLNAERIKDVQQELQQELQKTTLYSEVLRCIVSKLYQGKIYPLHWDKRKYQDN